VRRQARLLLKYSRYSSLVSVTLNSKDSAGASMPTTPNWSVVGLAEALAPRGEEGVAASLGNHLPL
jgi:hypothetical protein